MNKNEKMILIKGEPKDNIRSCYYDNSQQRIVVEYDNCKKYPYVYNSVEIIDCFVEIDTDKWQITNNSGMRFTNISRVLRFVNRQGHNYYRIIFSDGTIKNYDSNYLLIEENMLAHPEIKSLLEYYKFVADIIKLNDDYGDSFLRRQIERIYSIGSDTVLAHFINHTDAKTNTLNKPIIFPFGSNLSQIEAVEKALFNQVSVIEGPPGTGKTQTILNIIANAIVNQKTVAVVSNNNSATSNVFEKLQKYGYDYVAAQLGSNKNKESFIDFKQQPCPNLSDDLLNEYEINLLFSAVRKLRSAIVQMMTEKNKIALLKQELSALEIEKQHFDEYYSQNSTGLSIFRKSASPSSKTLMEFWLECENSSWKDGKRPSLLFRLKNILFVGIKNIKIFNNELSKIILELQYRYYRAKHRELTSEIENLQKHLETINYNEKIGDLTDKSTKILNAILAKRYSNHSRPIFESNVLWQKPMNFISEYPVILSTTHSLISSLKDITYDYVIVDESSQVDLVTGVLAMSCARNIVVVGDRKQLPNVIKEKPKKMISEISDQFNVPEKYRFEINNLLTAICDVFVNAPKTLLREHYRCHPKIIDFCNKKFYDEQLVIMTEDNGENDVLKAHVTAVGNHARDHYNQRQIDEIKQVILPELASDDVGIISPYNQQTDSLVADLGADLDISTVHRFQGREKKDIIISTVDNRITEFTDNANLLNVAVSRAQNRLRLVVSAGDHTGTNIGDLLNYIKYNNFDISNSKIYSVFDMLYQAKEDARKEFLKNRRKISEYDSENLMQAVIDDVLNDARFSTLEVVSHFPLNTLIRDVQKLTNEEKAYALHPRTHLDFLIYSIVDKSPILAIEVDGYKYHKAGTRQHERDCLKDSVLLKYDIPLIRFSTTGSNEKETLVGKLNQLI